ncbi:alpha/beta hydrolase [Marinomonas sp. M1K-6]|uniref:Alpha/beta hydrolase n=1 Tax=Marinomonas profundi TaxID=2726122 RepID=A0A847R5H3_9GAMM|nr:alpha/beta hydrolase [Marinomonas profundi]NLQ16267.1 alpha/beta hydrolase [Marinomonas profundi]UDV03156.1 alpha/beta hydrolase [Marinomonas profundi]
MGNEIVYQLPHTEIAGLQWLPKNASALKILSLHGWLDNAESFSNLSPHLANFSHTAIDFAGHGLSIHRPAGSFYHLWDHVLDVVSILNQSKQSVWLIGHSMGGAVAMLVAAIAPDKVRGLIVLDNMGPLSASPSERVVNLQRSVNKMLKYRLGKDTRYPTKEAMVLARMEGFTSLSRLASTILVDRGARQNDEGGWVWRHDGKLTFPSPFRMDEEGVEAFIQEIKCPTLALVANNGIYQDNRLLVDKRAAQFPWIKLKWLDGNHHFHLEPDSCALVAAEIQQFIDQN